MIKLEDWLKEEDVKSVTSSSATKTESVPTYEHTATNNSDVDYDEVRSSMAVVVNSIEEAGVDIAPTRNEYRNLAWALQDAFGSSEEGYELFLRLSHLWSDPRGQSDGDIRMQWIQFLHSNKYLNVHSTSGISYKTFFYMAQEKGIDITTN